MADELPEGAQTVERRLHATIFHAALPLRMANELTDGVKLSDRLMLSIGCQATPSLPVSEYWPGLHALNELGAVAPVGVAGSAFDSGPTPKPLTAATLNENVFPLGR